MELQPVTDTAAKQAIDASRAYKEMVRVQRQLRALGGSMFWKPVGSYEYLAQRCGRQVKHLGARSSETELQYEKFQQERDRLQAREKSLQVRIKLHERINRAVHAGAAPAPVIQMLDTLEDAGAGEDGLVLGSAALLAYWQASGLQQPTQVTDALDASFWVLLHEKLSPQAKRKLQRSKAFHVSEVKLRGNSFLKFLSSSSHHLKPARNAKYVKEVSLSALSAGERDDALGLMLSRIRDLPAFEQVVIGKSGKMGLMRTVDPQVFLDWCDSPVGETLNIESELGEWVQQLVSERRIQSKVQAGERLQLAG